MWEAFAQAIKSVRFSQSVSVLGPRRVTDLYLVWTQGVLIDRIDIARTAEPPKWVKKLV